MDHDGRRAEVHAARGEPDQVAVQARHLGHEHADRLRTGRDVDAEELLDGERVRELVAERVHVVHTGHVRGPLDVHQVFGGLLHAGVQVPDDRLDAQHLFTVELEHETQHAVRGRVLRPHVDDHRLVLGREELLVEVDVRDDTALAAQLGDMRLARHHHLLRALIGRRRRCEHRRRQHTATSHLRHASPPARGFEMNLTGVAGRSRSPLNVTGIFACA